MQLGALRRVGLDPVLGEEKSSGTNYTQSAAAEVVGIPERERQIMADWYACTWVDVRDYELKAETRRGVVPGNPMADLLLNVVMVTVLEEIHKGSGEMSGGMVPFAAGQNIGYVPRVVGCDDIVPASDVTYVDDLCLMVSAEKPNELIERTAEMIRVCRRAVAKHECILRPFGHGSQDLVACLQRVDGQRVITVDGAVVRMVRSCKHLGTIHTATGNLTEEATARVRAMIAENNTSFSVKFSARVFINVK